MNGKLLFLQALTPIHSSTGQGIDVIDLPVAREKVTNWPYLPGSSLKGVLRDRGRNITGGETLLKAAFGPDTEKASEGAGMLLFCDSHLLCLPVRSFKGTFAWVTCPSVLKRLERDAKTAGVQFDLPPVTVGTFDAAHICTGSALNIELKVYLEELDLTYTETANGIADIIAPLVFTDPEWQDYFKRRFAIVSDDLFTFLSETATEVTARIKIMDETKTVAKGGLWYEESVPAESLFWAPILAAPRGGITADVLFNFLNKCIDGVVQIGGNATTGCGLTQISMRGRE